MFFKHRGNKAKTTKLKPQSTEKIKLTLYYKLMIAGRYRGA